jgi:hypothetical protein
MERITARHQLALQSVRHAQPVHIPVGGKSFSDGESREQVATGATGGDQKPGHGWDARLKTVARLT